MRVLLDTNVFLWSISGERAKLSVRAAAVVEDEANELWLSAVSLWEIALKARAGKLELPEHAGFWQHHMTVLRISRVLPVEVGHIYGLFPSPTTIGTHSIGCWWPNAWSKGSPWWLRTECCVATASR